MTMTTKPATPQLFGIAHGYIVTANDAAGTIGLNARIVTKLSEDNGAAVKTLVNRANAYPGLVAALKQSMSLLEGFYEGEPASRQPAILRKHHALLRSLGEEV